MFHTDGAKAVVDVPIIFIEYLGEVDMLTLVGHKFGSLKSIPYLYVIPGYLAKMGRQEPGLYFSSVAFILCVGQEGGQRSGTKNVPYIVGLGHSVELLTSEGKWRDSMA